MVRLYNATTVVYCEVATECFRRIRRIKKKILPSSWMSVRPSFRPPVRMGRLDSHRTDF